MSHLNIQAILIKGFILLIAAPLPILLLSSPLGYIWEKLMYRRYYGMVRNHFERPEMVSAEQLSVIFPKKRTEELNQIAYYLQEESSYRDN